MFTYEEKKPLNRTGIPSPLRKQFETKSGVSLDDVRVHYNSASPARFGALAYTRGNQVHIGPGQERHLPHELGHVIQQKQGMVKPNLRINEAPVNFDPKLEEAADSMQFKFPQNACEDVIQMEFPPKDKEKLTNLFNALLDKYTKDGLTRIFLSNNTNKIWELYDYIYDYLTLENRAYPMNIDLSFFVENNLGQGIAQNERCPIEELGYEVDDYVHYGEMDLSKIDKRLTVNTETQQDTAILCDRLNKFLEGPYSGEMKFKAYFNTINDVDEEGMIKCDKVVIYYNSATEGLRDAILGLISELKEENRGESPVVETEEEARPEEEETPNEYPPIKLLGNMSAFYKEVENNSGVFEGDEEGDGTVSFSQIRSRMILDTLRALFINSIQTALRNMDITSEKFLTFAENVFSTKGYNPSEPEKAAIRRSEPKKVGEPEKAAGTGESG